MQMSDYIEGTKDATSAIFGEIRSSRERIFHLKIDIHNWIHLENYIKGKEHKGHGPGQFDLWVKDMGKDPTVEKVSYWRNQLRNILVARKTSTNTLCASILMIAQNGIKLTLGKPSNWAMHQNQILSSQNECLLEAIWHGRNLIAHVEGLKPNGTSYKYFEQLEARTGLRYISGSRKYSATDIVKDVLGWIDIHALRQEDNIHDLWPSNYEQDMLRIGTLA